jgi:plasmid stabilization system protein ParE
MAKTVLLTPIAKDDLENVMTYLFENWSLNVLENFLALYEPKIATIADYPDRFPVIHQKSGLRKAVLTRHNIILYREKPDHIEVISVFDTRQNPVKLNRLTE